MMDDICYMLIKYKSWQETDCTEKNTPKYKRTRIGNSQSMITTMIDYTIETGEANSLLSN